MGEIKPTRIRTRLPVRSTSVMDSLLERDMVGNEGGAQWRGIVEAIRCVRVNWIQMPGKSSGQVNVEEKVMKMEESEM